MIIRFFVILLTCSVLLNGCRSRSRPSEEEAAEKNVGMIQIENLTVGERSLTLDYKVSNPFGYDIWVCEDIDIYGIHDVETRIIGGTVQIKLCFNLECNLIFEEEVFAKYRLLSPGESYSGEIPLNLPIRNDSPVYAFHEDRTKYRQRFLQCATFKVGYIAAKEMIQRYHSDANNIVIVPKFRDEVIEGQSRTFAYVPHIWPELTREESAEVLIADVNIPCSVEML